MLAVELGVVRVSERYSFRNLSLSLAFLIYFYF